MANQWQWNERTKTASSAEDSIFVEWRSKDGRKVKDGRNESGINSWTTPPMNDAIRSKVVVLESLRG